MGLTYEDIIGRIKEEKGLSDEEIQQRIKEKLAKLSGLISQDGAAHIVANELGIDIIESVKRKGIKIHRLLPGMRGVGVLGKVVQVYGTKEFNKNGRSGKVMSLLVGDETGLIRLVLWDNNLIQILEDGKVTEGDIVKVSDGNVRENNGYTEIHSGTTSKVILRPEGEQVTVISRSTPVQQQQTLQRKSIQALQDGDSFVAITGTIMQLFEPRFYDACATCGKKVYGTCTEHVHAAVQSVPIINLFFDDGTDSIRAVFFRQQALELLGMSDEQMTALKMNLGIYGDLKQQLQGKEMTLVGRVVKNEMFERKEFLVQQLIEVQPVASAEALLQS